MIAAHHEQSFVNSCTPACACMIQKWRGQPPTEARFHEGAPDEGYDVEQIVDAAWLSGVRKTSLGPDEEDELRVAVDSGDWVVVKLATARYGPWLAAQKPQRMSRHGALWRPGEWAYHSVVVVDYDVSSWSLLDPWFSATGQPVKIPDTTFSSCFAGLAVIARR